MGCFSSKKADDAAKPATLLNLQMTEEDMFRMENDMQRMESDMGMNPNAAHGDQGPFPGGNWKASVTADIAPMVKENDYWN